jgi:hypothetical protein
MKKRANFLCMLILHTILKRFYTTKLGSNMTNISEKKKRKPTGKDIKITFLL